MNESNTFAVLWRTFRRYRWHVAALVLFGFLSALLEGIGINAVIPLISFFTGGGGEATDFITRAIQGLFAFLHIPFSFRYLLGFILGLFILRAASVVFFGYIRGWIGADFLGKESEDVLRRTMQASWPFLLKQKIGTMHNTLVRDIQCTSSLLGVVGQVIQSFSGFCMYLLVALNISPAMTLYTLGGGVLLVFAVRPLLRRTRQIGEQAAGVEKQFAQFLSEHIIGMKSVKAAGAEQAAMADGGAHIRLLRALSIKLSLVRALSGGLFQPFSLILVVLLFTLTYKAPGFSIISFAATLYLIQKIFTYLESGQNALHSIGEMVPYARHISNFKNKLDANREPVSAGKEAFNFKESMQFENVSLQYEEGRLALCGISFAVKRGSTVGLIGPSGAGKTSVADLVMRLFEPTEGRLVLDGRPAGDFSLTDWRQRIGYVGQDIFLFNGSIEDNIRMYRDLSHDEVVEAAVRANIHDHVVSLPQGYRTVVGDRGVMLSGGQRQRVALARALAGNPEMLVLDEATSALDVESEQLIQQSIKSLQGKITVFIIAHRLSTIENADTLLVFDKGRLIERGSPEELRQTAGSYFAKQ